MTYVPETWVDYSPPCIDAAHLNAIEHGIDIAQGDVMVLGGLTANRPAFDAELVGRLYFATDAPYEISRDNGGGWDVVGYTSDLFTALGTLQVGSGAGAAAPLGIGGAGNVLTVAGGTAAWAAPAAGGAWNLIAETILGAPAATVTFAPIPGTYRTLALLTQGRTDVAAENDGLMWRANADAGNNYDYIYAYDAGNNTRASAAAIGVNQAWGSRTEGANSRSDNWSPSIIWWLGYALADREKYAASSIGMSFGDLSGVADLAIWLNHGHWRNTAAITSLTLRPAAGANFVTGCHFTLYGIT